MGRFGLALAGLGVAAALTACTGDDDGSEFADGSAEDIVAAARADMDDLESVKVSGTVTTDGQEITIDLQSSSAGDCTGSISIDDGSAEILGVGGDTWMRPDEAFWRSFAGDSTDTVIELVGDKWVEIPAGEDSFDQFCDVDQLLDDLLEVEKDDGSSQSVAGTEELEGDEVVLIDNEDPEEGTSTGYVLVDDPHYLVQIEKNEGEDTGAVTFSAFDEEFEVEAPARDEVVDLESLGS